MRFFRYIGRLINSETNESSKRLIALAVTVLSIYVAVRYTDRQNVEVILVEILSFILVLSGVSVWEKVKKRQD
tara:strand:+ start:822 stop:1040 length:219 start_codon:yes stop_codon:yes gene_type:complete